MTVPRRILLVDDEQEVIDHLAPFLKRAGYVVESAADGEEALAKIAQLKPEMIILDILMPKLSVPFLHSVLPAHLVPWINLLSIVIIVYAIYKILTNTRIAGRLTDFLRSHIVKKEIIKPKSTTPKPTIKKSAHLSPKPKPPRVEMKNAEIAAVFSDIAYLLKCRKDNIFKIRAYEKAAKSIAPPMVPPLPV